MGQAHHTRCALGKHLGEFGAVFPLVIDHHATAIEQIGTDFVLACVQRHVRKSHCGHPGTVILLVGRGAIKVRRHGGHTKTIQLLNQQADVGLHPLRCTGAYRDAQVRRI